MTDQPIAPRLEQALRPLLRGPLPVRLRAWDGSTAGPDPASYTGPTVVLTSPRALRRLLWHPGELGAARAYVTGELDVEGDLAEAVQLARAAAQLRGLTGLTAAGLVRAAPALLALARETGAIGPALPPPASEARMSGRRNTPLRDRAAIHHHYDLSNEFYELILDEHMAYSCAYFVDGPDMTLRDAQAAKLELICRKLDLAPGRRLLDVGCGWGSLALYAAEHHGVRVHGVTIAPEQKAFIDPRITERGLQDLVTIEVRDYREIGSSATTAEPFDAGPFDAVASIEMGEHVGQRNYPIYARTLHDAVRPGGRVLVQQMSRPGRHPGGGPFIEAFIAPDMHMRPLGQTLAMLQDAGLEVRDVQALREHYVTTVEAWRRTLDDDADQAADLIGVEGLRVWQLYLGIAPLAFRDGRMGVDQLLLRRPIPGENLSPQARC